MARKYDKKFGKWDTSAEFNLQDDFEIIDESESDVEEVGEEEEAEYNEQLDRLKILQGDDDGPEATSPAGEEEIRTLFQGSVFPAMKFVARNNDKTAKK